MGCILKAANNTKLMLITGGELNWILHSVTTIGAFHKCKLHLLFGSITSCRVINQAAFVQDTGVVNGKIIVESLNWWVESNPEYASSNRRQG
mgnify:CR=1 FL=1